MNFVENPAWVNAVIGRVYATIEAKVDPKWLPLLGDGKPTRGGFTVKPKEYGCGAYGCVLPTHDNDVVLKVTTDTTESEFAVELNQTLVERMTVDYLFAMKLTDKHHGRPIHLLWREAAANVGAFSKQYDGARLESAVTKQHRAAQRAFIAVTDGADAVTVRHALQRWLDATELMRNYPPLQYLASGLIKVWEQQHIFFGDIHAGNLGQCQREGKPTWVVTDPGHVAVITDPALHV